MLDAPSVRTHRTTRLLLVDDHELTRESLKDMLADEPDMEVVGEAPNGRLALALCARLQPDVVMMDVRMPEMDGLSATREVKQRRPETAVLMVTMHENTDYLLEALRAGAAGYVLKDAPQEEVLRAVRQVVRGESPLDQALATRLLRRLATDKPLARAARTRTSNQASVQPLTRRELEVLDLLKFGMTNRQVAQELFISARTVKNHVEHVIGKLGVSDRTQAVVRALDLGLIELSS